jgi:predicted dehydrogenase
VSSPLEIGIIGLGFGSQVHVPAFRRDVRCRVAAIAGRDAAKATAVAEKLEIGRGCGDWREIVEDPNIGAIAIAVPPCEQAAIAIAAAEAGKHLFCEKPLAADDKAAAAMLDAAQKAGVVHGIDFIFPELPLWQRAREIIAGGSLGKIRHVDLNWRVETYAARTRAQNWKNDPKHGGGVLNNFVSHVVHNVRWLFGEISAVTASLRGPLDMAETAVQATLDMEGGFPVFISVASDAFLGQGHSLAVYGEEGSLLLQNPTADYASGFELSTGTRKTGKLALVARDDLQPGVDGRLAPVARLAGRFVDAITGGLAMSPNFADGLRVQEFLHEMRVINRAISHAEANVHELRIARRTRIEAANQ